MTMFTLTYTMLLMKLDQEDKALGPKQHINVPIQPLLKRQPSTWNSEDTGESHSSLYFLRPDDTLLKQLQQDRETEKLSSKLRRSNSDILQWHFLPTYFNEKTPTRLMSKSCMQTNAVDALRYCLNHPDLQENNKDTLIEILKVIIRLNPILRDHSHELTRYILLYIVRHKSALNTKLPPNILKIQANFQIQRPENIKSLCLPFQGLGRSFEDLNRLTAPTRALINTVAHLHTFADDICDQITLLQKKLQHMDEQQEDLFIICAHAYREILRIKPFASNNTVSAVTLVNSILSEKGLNPISLEIAPTKMNLDTYCQIMQSKRLTNLARYIKKQYILQNLNCKYTHHIITKQPQLIQQLLCQLITNHTDHLFIQLLDQCELLNQAQNILNSPLSDGWTILHYACKNNKDMLMTRLIELGADPSITNYDRKTPFDLINDKVLRNSKILTQFPIPRTPER